ncbi:MAG: aldo/keto reductase [Bacteroidales bacterium]
MRYRNLGGSDIRVSEISFGAWAIGGWQWGGTDESAAIRAIHKSFEMGVTTIDTAPIYGFGRSEKIVGEAIKGNRDKYQILTKFGLRWDSKDGLAYLETQDNRGNPLTVKRIATKASVIYECEQSLKRLGTDYIDLLQIHRPDPNTPIKETFLALNELMSSGKIRAVGVSNYTIDMMEEALRYTKIATNQVHYNMVARGIEKEIVPFCMKHNMGILPYSPLQRGLLTGKITPNHKFNEGDSRSSNPYFTQENIIKTNNFLDNIRPIAERNNCTLSQLVINWTLSRSAISSILVGARNEQQAEDNALALQREIPKSDINEINELLKSLNINV